MHVELIPSAARRWGQNRNGTSYRLYWQLFYQGRLSYVGCLQLLWRADARMYHISAVFVPVNSLDNIG